MSGVRMGWVCWYRGGGDEVRPASASASMPSNSSVCDRWRELGKLMPARLLVSVAYSLNSLAASWAS